MLQQNYSDILLVFDFEPQDHRYDLDDHLYTAAEKQDANIKDDAFCYILNTGLFFLPQFNSDWVNL